MAEDTAETAEFEIDPRGPDTIVDGPTETSIPGIVQWLAPSSPPNFASLQIEPAALVFWLALLSSEPETGNV